MSEEWNPYGMDAMVSQIDSMVDRNVREAIHQFIQGITLIISTAENGAVHARVWSDAFEGFGEKEIDITGDLKSGMEMDRDIHGDENAEALVNFLKSLIAIVEKSRGDEK